MMHGSVEISSRNRPAAIRSGRVGDEHVLADLQAAALLEVAGDELGRAGRDRRAQDQRVAGAQQRQQVVDRGADLTQVALDVGERRRADRDHDVVGRGGVGGALGELAGGRSRRRDRAAPGCRPRSNGIRPAADRVEHRAVVVDAEHAQPAVGEATAPAAGRRGPGR